MILLELIILIIGLLISLLSLTGSASQSNNNSRRNLAILYLLLCAFSAIIIIIKSGEADKSGLKLFNTLHSIEKQSDTLVTLLDSISALKNKMDVIVARTEEAIIQRERSQKIFNEQNKLLERSNELTQKQLEEAKPEIMTYTPHITFNYIDSINTQCRIVFTNEGKRIAKNFKDKTIHVFKNKNDNKYFTHIVTDSDVSDVFPEKMLVSTYLLPFNYNKIFTMTSGGMIIISLIYYDELFNSKIEKQLIFSMQIDNDNIKIFKEGSIPKELEEYLFKNKINLTIK